MDDAITHDLAVLTLSHPLDLDGPDARAARLPSASAAEPSSHTHVVFVGYGRENIKQQPDGTLNEAGGLIVHKNCTTRGALCVWSTTSAVCPGDSGGGLVEPGSPPTVVGLASQSNGAVSTSDCTPADFTHLEPSDDYPEGYIFLGGDTYLGSPAALRFITASL